MPFSVEIAAMAGEMAKRTLDIVFSIVGLMLLAPLLLVLMLAVKVTSPGPIFYRGLRVGRYGRHFRIFKFRTMLADAEGRGGSCTASTDPRITPIGRFLRRYKVDELPQLLNVIKGEMSLVGPRPEVEEYVSMYTETEKQILHVRPGITDWASLWDSDEEAVLATYDDPERAYLEIIRPTKLRLQLRYVHSHSLFGDLWIILLTLRKIVQMVMRKDRISPQWRRRSSGPQEELQSSHH